MAFTQGFDPNQLLQLLGSIGINDPDQLAAILAPTGFVPPVGPALGQLSQPVTSELDIAPGGPTPNPNIGAELDIAPGGPGASPAAAPSAGVGNFLKALAAVEVPDTPQAPRVTNLSGNVPRGGGTIDPRQIAAILELLSTGQGGPAQGISALGGLITGGR